VRGLLLVVLATAALAQSKPVFQIDGVSPREGGAAELLETLCPGQVETGQEVKCRESPDDIARFECSPTATMVTRGHFLPGATTFCWHSTLVSLLRRTLEAPRF